MHRLDKRVVATGRRFVQSRPGFLETCNGPVPERDTTTHLLEGLLKEYAYLRVISCNIALLCLCTLSHICVVFLP